MPTVSIHNNEIYYEDHGSGPAIVLLHGFPLDGRSWQYQISPLSRQYRVISPDFRGFGNSKNAGPFSIRDLATDVHQLIAHLKIAPCIVAGLSMGGYVALAHAKEFAGDLKGLILLDTKAEPDTADAKITRGKMIALTQSEGSGIIAKLMLPRLLPATGLKNPDLVPKMMEMITSQSPDTIVHALGAMRDRPDLTDSLPKIPCPTLVITGDLDLITTPETCLNMQKKIPKSRLEVIAETGHMTSMEHPSKVNALIAEFAATITEK